MNKGLKNILLTLSLIANTTYSRDNTLTFLAGATTCALAVTTCLKNTDECLNIPTMASTLLLASATYSLYQEKKQEAIACIAVAAFINSIPSMLNGNIYEHDTNDVYTP